MNLDLILTVALALSFGQNTTTPSDILLDWNRQVTIERPGREPLRLDPNGLDRDLAAPVELFPGYKVVCPGGLVYVWDLKAPKEFTVMRYRGGLKVGPAAKGQYRGGLKLGVDGGGPTLSVPTNESYVRIENFLLATQRSRKLTWKDIKLEIVSGTASSPVGFALVPSAGNRALWKLAVTPGAIGKAGTRLFDDSEEEIIQRLFDKGIPARLTVAGERQMTLRLISEVKSSLVMDLRTTLAAGLRTPKEEDPVRYYGDLIRMATMWRELHLLNRSCDEYMLLREAIRYGNAPLWFEQSSKFFIEGPTRARRKVLSERGKGTKSLPVTRKPKPESGAFLMKQQ